MSRRWTKILENVPSAAWIGGKIADRRFKQWRKANPDRPFSQFYVDDVIAKTARGSGHPTLGAKGFAGPLKGEVSWDRANFAARAREIWDFYADVIGAKPGMRCVDYGCGSLRVGQHAMRALDPGDYWGLDVSEDFITSGLDLVDPQVIEDKRPRLSVISDSTVAEVRNWQPHAIFSNAVLQHVPEPELLSFFRRMAAMMSPGTIAAINFVDRPKVSRVKAMSWAYPDELLIAKAIEADPGLIAECSVISAAHAKAFPDRRRLLVLRRPAD